LGKGFRGYLDRTDSALVFFVIVLVLILLAVVLHQLFGQRGKVPPNARRIFKHFLKMHALSRPEGRALWSVARHCALENPSIIFVKRSLFETASLELRLDPGLIETLRQKLYGP